MGRIIDGEDIDGEVIVEMVEQYSFFGKH